MTAGIRTKVTFNSTKISPTKRKYCGNDSLPLTKKKNLPVQRQTKHTYMHIYIYKKRKLYGQKMNDGTIRTKIRNDMDLGEKHTGRQNIILFELHWGMLGRSRCVLIFL